MQADTLEHFVLLACAGALFVACVLAFPLIWTDLQRDLRRRVEDDAEPAAPTLFDQERDVEWNELLAHDAGDVGGASA